MIKTRTITWAEFHWGTSTTSIDVFLKGNRKPISLFADNIDFLSRKLSKSEIDMVIQKLLIKKEVLSRKGDFPHIYDEMLQDLISTYKERYGGQVWKGEDRNDITSKCHYTLSINQLEELLEKRYKFTRVRIDSVSVGKTDSSMTTVEIEPEGSLFVSFREVEEDEETM
jgi:hypothetical protein